MDMKKINPLLAETDQQTLINRVRLEDFWRELDGLKESGIANEDCADLLAQDVMQYTKDQIHFCEQARSSFEDAILWLKRATSEATELRRRSPYLRRH